MIRRSAPWFVLLLVVAILTLALLGNAQRARAPKVTSLQATTDRAGPHPATVQIAGPAPILCIAVFSETPNVEAKLSCHIVAPGFRGNLKKGETADATGAGTVTLTCSGPGMLRCNARIN